MGAAAKGVPAEVLRAEKENYKHQLPIGRPNRLHFDAARLLGRICEFSKT
jgi:hypothetical protein